MTRALSLTVVLVVVVLVGAAASLAQRDVVSAGPKRLLFPVVGKTHYTDDFGAARPQGSHQATDIMSDWRAPLVAVESGRVQIWTKSARAGCMLYLYGESGAKYLYVHLNNDLTAKNDNRGGCRSGVAFATGLRDGETVRAGELLGYIGDSGDANGIHHHVHFELHPDGRSPVSPFPLLRKASQLLFAMAPSEAHRVVAPTKLKVEGTLRAIRIGVAGPELTMAVSRVVLWNDAQYSVARNLTVRVPETAVVLRRDGQSLRTAELEAGKVGERVTILTEPLSPSLAAQVAAPRFFAAAELTLAAPKRP